MVSYDTIIKRGSKYMRYLNEKRYQKTNRSVKIVGTIISLIGLALLGIGIYFAVTSFKEDVITDAMSKRSLGMFLIIPGVFVTVVGCMIRFVMGNRREIMAYHTQQMMPIMQESMEQMMPTMSKMMDEMTPTVQRRVEAMAPTMGKVAEEITRGVKEGLKEE